MEEWGNSRRTGQPLSRIGVNCSTISETICDYDRQEFGICEDKRSVTGWPKGWRCVQGLRTHCSSYEKNLEAG